MWEPNLLSRLDSIKHHLMTGMAPHYVIDEIECLQRDIEAELRGRGRPRDFARYKPMIEFQGDFVEVKEIRLTDVPLDHEDLKIDESPLQFDSGYYPIRPEVKHRLYQLKIEPQATQGEKHPLGVHGYTPQKSNCPEYVEGPPPTWVTSLKVPENPNFGDKPLKTFAGRDLR